VKCLGVRLAGDAIEEVDDQGVPIVDDTILYLMNASPDAVSFLLPAFVPGAKWDCIVDTFDDQRRGGRLDGGTAYRLDSHSVAVFVLARDGRESPA
jgi:glycogen operon protein